MNTLLPLLIDAYQHWLANYDIGQDHLRVLLHDMRQLGNVQPVAPHLLPVVPQYLGRAAELATVPALITLISTLLRVGNQLDWITTPVQYVGSQFADNFAFTQLAGPPILGMRPIMYPSQNIAVGFSLQAPHTFYPRHKHKALEFYGVLAGTALWQMGDGEWQAKPPGSFIFHDSEVIHAMQTQEEPLLTTFAWVGDFCAPIRAE